MYTFADPLKSPFSPFLLSLRCAREMHTDIQNLNNFEWLLDIILSCLNQTEKTTHRNTPRRSAWVWFKAAITHFKSQSASLKNIICQRISYYLSGKITWTLMLTDVDRKRDAPAHIYSLSRSLQRGRVWTNEVLVTNLGNLLWEILPWISKLLLSLRCLTGSFKGRIGALTVQNDILQNSATVTWHYKRSPKEVGRHVYPPTLWWSTIYLGSLKPR